MAHAQRHYPVDEYFAIEAMSEIRHEYFDGEIIAMSGGSKNHNRITLNLERILDPLAGRGCEAYVNDLRVKTPSGLYTYPDVMLVCGDEELIADDETITNPVLLAEVLSASTAEYDRGQKFDLYSSIPTLRDYLLIDQYKVDVEHRWLDAGTWERKHYTEGEFDLTGVPLTIEIAKLYHRVRFRPGR
jgi:Uma2 family endonuclease